MATLYRRGEIYWAGINENGIQKCFSLKTKNKRVAMSKLKEIDDTKGLTINQALQEWIDSHFMCAESYISSVTRCCNHFRIWYGDKSINCLDRMVLFDFLVYLEATKGFNDTTVSIVMRNLKVVFIFAYNEDLISRNPFKSFKAIPNGRMRKEFLNPTQIKQLLKAADSRPLYRHIIELLILTGMRGGELRKLKWSDIFEDYLKLHGKTGIREFPMLDEIKDCLSKIKNLQAEGTEFVLSTEKGIWQGRNSEISQIVRRYLNEAGLPKYFTCHSLRHTFCSLLVKSGEELITVSKLAGHANINMTMRYAHIDPKLIKTKTKHW